MKISIPSVLVLALFVTLAFLTYSDKKKAASGYYEKQAEELKASYLAEKTVNFWGYPRDGSEDTVVALPEKIDSSDMLAVKIHLRNKGGGGGYVTALTNVKDLQIGEKVLLRIIETTDNTGNQWTCRVADRLPSGK